MSTLRKKTTVSKASKRNVIGLPIIHPRITRKGVTRSAICMLLPMATPIARSILFLIETTTAVTCSAALPTIGRRIRPINVLLILAVSTIESILSTRNSAQTATPIVMTTSAAPAAQGVKVGSSWSSSLSAPCSSSKRSW